MLIFFALSTNIIKDAPIRSDQIALFLIHRLVKVLRVGLRYWVYTLLLSAPVLVNVIIEAVGIRVVRRGGDLAEDLALL